MPRRTRPGGAIEYLDLRDAVHVGHSTDDGEVTRYIGRHDTARVAKVVLLSAIPPLMLRTEAKPEGLHGDDDQIMPIVAATRKSIDLVPTEGGARWPTPWWSPGPATTSRRRCGG